MNTPIGSVLGGTGGDSNGYPRTSPRFRTSSNRQRAARRRPRPSWRPRSGSRTRRPLGLPRRIEDFGGLAAEDPRGQAVVSLVSDLNRIFETVHEDNREDRHEQLLFVDSVVSG